MPETLNLNADRRDYFRIADRVAFRIRPVSHGDLPVQVPNDLQPMFSLLEEMRNIDEEQVVILRNISDKSRDLGQYLKSLQRKMELIARYVVMHQVQGSFQLNQVNLSANGIGFTNQNALKVNEWVDIDMVVFPESLLICTRAKIISCHHLADQFNIGAEFVNLSDHDRDAIVRHCLLIDGLHRRQERDE